MADLSQQLQLQQQINEALSERNRILDAQNRTLSGQADLAGDLAASLGSPRVNSNINNMNSALQRSSSVIKDTRSTAKDLEGALNDAADAAEEASEQTGFFSEALGSLGSAIGGIGSVLGAAGSAFLSIASSIAKAAFAIFTFPLKIFGSLVQMAQEGSGDMPIAKAFEDLRDVLGDLSTGPAKSVRSTFDGIRNSSRKLAGGGITVRQIFGYGRDGLAALLKDLTELATATGDRISRLGPVFESMGDKAITFQRGLGASKEEFADLVDLAKLRGKDPEKAMTSFSKTAILTAKRFGMSTKDMAKGMKELTLDIENFGHLGPKAFAPITAYARKLGLEIKDMAGIMDKFAGFTASAEAASQLGQVFQMAVDPMQLMAAQNPAEKIDMLRKSFFKTGKSLKEFSYQQRKYLSQISGLPPKAMEAAFALDNQGMSYEKIKNEADQAASAQMSQKEVLAELQKGIKRLIEVLDMPKVTGFFDAFMKGFERGIMRSKEFRGTLRNIRRGLQHMMRFGIQIGKMFARVFPGMKDMLNGLSDFLHPKKFKAFTKGLKPIFKMFFEGKKSFGGMMMELKDRLTGQFAPSGLKKVATGFLKFANATAKLLAGAFKFIFEIIRKQVLPFMKNVFADAKEYVAGGEGRLYITGIVKSLFKHFNDAIGSDVGGYARKILDAFAPLGKVFGEGSEFQKMIAEAQPLMSEAVDMMAHDFKEIGRKIGCGIWEGIMYVWDNTSLWEKLLYGAGFMTLMAPRFMLGVGASAGKFLLKGLGKVLGFAAAPIGKAALAGGKALTATGGKAATSGMGLARGGLVKMDAARALKAAEAASSTAAMQKASQSAIDKGLRGAAKSSHTKKVFDSTYKNMMKSHRSNITRGTSKFLKESSKIAIKESTKAATVAGKASTRAAVQATTKVAETGFKAALKTTGSALGKFAVPFLFDIGVGIYEAYQAAPNERGERFLSGLVSSLTLGVFDADEVQDAFFQSKKVLTREAEAFQAGMPAIYEKYAAAFKKPMERFDAHMNEMVRKARALGKEIANIQINFDDVLSESTLETIAILGGAESTAEKRQAASLIAVDKYTKRITAVSAVAERGLEIEDKYSKTLNLKDLTGDEQLDLVGRLQEYARANIPRLRNNQQALMDAFHFTTDEKGNKVLRIKGSSSVHFADEYLRTKVKTPAQIEKEATMYSAAIVAENDLPLHVLGLTIPKLSKAIEEAKSVGADTSALQARLDKELQKQIDHAIAGDSQKLVSLLPEKFKKRAQSRAPLTELLAVPGQNINEMLKNPLDFLPNDIQLNQSLKVLLRSMFPLTELGNKQYADAVTAAKKEQHKLMTERYDTAFSTYTSQSAMGGPIADKYKVKFLQTEKGKKLKAAAQAAKANIETTRLAHMKTIPGMGMDHEGNEAMRLDDTGHAAVNAAKSKARNAQSAYDTALKTAVQIRGKQDYIYGQVNEAVAGGDPLKIIASLGILPKARLEVITKKMKAARLRKLEKEGQAFVEGKPSTPAGKKVLTAAQKETAKLAALEQQQATLVKIRSMKEIPNALKSARKAFASIKVAKVEKDAKAMFTKAMAIGKGIERALDDSKIAEYAGRNAEETASVKGAAAVAGIIELSTNALTRIAASVRQLKKTIKDNLKFFTKLDLECLKCEVLKMSTVAAVLPTVLSKGMQPLLGNMPAKDGASEGETTAGENAVTNIAEAMKSTSAAIVTLEKVSNLVSSSAVHFEGLAGSIGKINKLKMPSIDPKRRQVMTGIVTTAMGMLNAASAGISGKGLAAVLTGQLDASDSKLEGKIKQATKNMKALGRFFKAARNTGRDAARASANAAAVRSNAKVLGEAVSTIAKQGEKLNSNVAKVVSGVSSDGTSKVTVKHTFGEKVKLNVSVKIDSENLGNKIFSVNVSGKDDKNQYGQVGDTAQVKRKTP